MSLTINLPIRKSFRLTTFRNDECVDLAACLRPESYMDYGEADTRLHSHSQYTRISHFQMLGFTILSHRFKFFQHINYLALTQPMAARRKFLSRFTSHTLSSASLHCPGCSLFKPVDSPGNTGGPFSYRVGQLFIATSCRTVPYPAQTQLIMAKNGYFKRQLNAKKSIPLSWISFLNRQLT